MLTSFWAEVANGQLKIKNRKAFDDYLASLTGDVVVAVGKHRKPRSIDQNGWYWGCILKLMSEVTGHTEKELHEAMKQRFNCKAITVGKQVVPIPGTTSDMNTMEFSEYCERVRAFAAAELNLVIPDPDKWHERV